MSEEYSLDYSSDFWEASRGSKPELWYKFKRFESLALLNLLLYQDQIMKLQRDIDYADGRMTQDQLRSLRELMRDYYEAMELFSSAAQLKRPSMNERQKAVSSLQHILPFGLHGDHYRFAADALGMVDLSPKAMGVEPDKLRVLLGRFSVFRFNTDDTLANYPDKVSSRHGAKSDVPPAVVDGAAPVTDQSADAEHGATSDPQGNVKPKRRHTINFLLRPLRPGPLTEYAARLIVAILTGIAILVPIIVLSYIKTTGYRLLATCLFVLVFAMAVSMGVSESNNELMGATAAYAAILVVFLGQTS